MAINPTYLDYAKQAAARYGVPLSGLEAQINMESGWNPSAKSSAGALGIAQFMPGTAASRHVNPLDPASAIPGMASLMHDLYTQEGHNWTKALEAYNAGPGNLSAGSGYAAKLLPSYTGASSSGPTTSTMTSGIPGMSSGHAPVDMASILKEVGISPGSANSTFLDHVMGMVGAPGGHSVASGTAIGLVGTAGGNQHQNLGGVQLPEKVWTALGWSSTHGARRVSVSPAPPISR